MSADQRRQDPESWEEVNHRKGKRNDHQGEGSKKVISKFYVSNLPPRCSSQDLKDVLGGFGRFEGSYIARKQDRWGKRFAFVSFSGVFDVKRMEEEMSDVWIGSYKLFITVARFVDGERVQKKAAVPKRNMVHQKVPVNPGTGGSREGGGAPVSNGSYDKAVGNGRSFVDSVLNRNKVDVVKVDDVVERFSLWNGFALVGRVVDFDTLTSLKTLIRNHDCPTVDIKYLGGYSVVLVFQDKENAEVFLKDYSVWAGWFESLVQWDSNVVVEEGRIAWLQVHGIPAQLSLDQVFDLIGSRYGKVVKSANMSGDDNDFLYALIGVLSKECKRIVDRLDISWRGKIFNVWVDEDVGEWTPDCIADYVDDECDVIQGEEKHSEPVQQERSGMGLGEEGEFMHAEEATVEVDVSGGAENGNGISMGGNVEVCMDGVSGSHSAAATGRKKFRRKNLFNNRNASSGSLERPKKRARDNNDMFGLNKLIVIGQVRKWLWNS
ncbi:putative RNA recognition motif domain, nucleotide-binding alpha-beta plait domain superfamily [Helianthus annuus]|uniref:RNA recognition motif domain, nucleotide-binding alpha-beta plait domain superfamily n=1 Tax=Helianthus annuus TaxID=4232 RepID=A0A9K3IRE6_HELAN|nr:putative RNA recognition motif domain, nucleotide-binding alpha-beta plait domain superfamily [Helianthus annuus]KAJ0572295.1 putative RNA recognition motif domain, nucleotide-binding alpha-beta plait domain superfamily [Helianthus annuus]KAJ0910399.1 putative RNA recognition motif domain, nucleotide-binding alpha-beta plait domain superfamily [Helianthus annuus]